MFWITDYDWLKDFKDLAKNNDEYLTFKSILPKTLNWKKEDGKLKCSLELPGRKKDGINVTVEDTTLKVTCEENNELGYSYFEKTFKLPRGSDRYEVSAKYEDGILYIEVPFNSEFSDKNVIRVEVE